MSSVVTVCVERTLLYAVHAVCDERTLCDVSAVRTVNTMSVGGEGILSCAQRTRCVVSDHCHAHSEHCRMHNAHNVR